MRLIPVSSAVILIFPLTSIAAQQPPSASPPPATAVTESFRAISALFGGRLVAAFVSIPADRYGYAPTPAQQTIGYVAQHLVEANYALCERFGGRPRPATAGNGVADTVKAKWPKDTLVAQLRDSFAFCATAMSNVDDAHLAEEAPVPGAGGGMTQQRARSLLLFATDLAEHYAQLSSYMRLLGMVPPSSVSPVRRVAIELPVSVLSRYVGTYEVPPSRQFGSPTLRFDVTVRDGALLVKPVGQPEAQLWPASETDFFLKVSTATLTFTRDSTGSVTGVVVHDNGEDRPGRKMK
jgi:uncharacterized damage-inducible protein DinB